MTDDLKRHEWKLPMANWLRDQINEILSRYDVPSDVYDADVQIDALCICAVDKIAADLRNEPGHTTNQAYAAFRGRSDCHGPSSDIKA